MKYYILKDHIPVKCYDLLEWATKYEMSNRIVKQNHFGNIMVSTVFLGLDHSFGNQGPPILFETMIFGGKHGGYQKRYSSWLEAEEGHKEAIKLVSVTKFLSTELVEETQNQN